MFSGPHNEATEGVTRQQLKPGHKKEFMCGTNKAA